MASIVLSIEPLGAPVFRHGFHLGTDERVARLIAEETFTGRVRNGMPTRTVALIWCEDGYERMIDTYDGSRWSSSYLGEG